MFKLTAIFTSALAVASVASAGIVPRKAPPAGWLTDILEDYIVYHTRYLALGCQFEHGKQFFNDCCHPLLKDQLLSSRPSQCTPSASASSSAAQAEPTSDVPTPEDSEPDSETVTVTSTFAAATTQASNDDGEDEDCDEDDDDGQDDEQTFSSSSPAPTTTKPAKTSSVEQVTSSSTKAKATSTSKPAAQPTSTPSNSGNDNNDGSDSGFETGGIATFYTQNGVAGACGDFHSDSDLICAIDSRRYGNTGEKSSLCGKKILIINENNGKTVTVTMADACPTCENSNSIDLSVKAFNQIATEEEGIAPIKWKFIS